MSVLSQSLVVSLVAIPLLVRSKTSDRLQFLEQALLLVMKLKM